MFEKFQLVRADRSFKESIELYMKSYGRTDISDWQIGDCLDVGNKMRYAYTWFRGPASRVVEVGKNKLLGDLVTGVMKDFPQFQS